MASSARIDELRKKFEENPRRYFAPLANEYRKAGDVDQAIAICRDYLPQQPGHMSGHIVYGQALYEARQYEEARTVFETALALDPENLIALRHLGDIALLVGDSEGARTWYGRVLEADPRNEEIQAQLQALEATPGAPAEPTPVSTAVPTPLSSPVVPPPHAAAPSAPAVVESLSTAPTVVVTPRDVPFERTAEQPALTARQEEPPPPFSSSAPTAEIDLDKLPTPSLPDSARVATPADASGTIELAAGFEPTAAPSPSGSTQPIEVDRVVPQHADAAVTDSFKLEGLETTSMAPAGTPAEQRPPEPPPIPAAPEPPMVELDLAMPAAPASATAGTPPAGSPPPVMPELMELTASPASPPVAASEPAADLPLIDLGLPAPAAPPPATTTASAPEPEVPAVAESQPFVTETMAELYEQQGHRAEALRVYRALLEQRPGDAHIRSRIERLESTLGPTIRQLIGLVAARRPGAAASPEMVPTADGSVPAPASAPAATDHAPATPVAAAPAPSAAAPAPSAAARADLLAPLFGNPVVSSRDEAAAAMLSAVFSRNGASEGAGLPGSPARPAARDLSLDTVFGREPGGQAPGGFSFDQFFSERATGAENPQGAQGQGAPPPGAPESADDAAKFTQWLEGLKQR